MRSHLTKLAIPAKHHHRQKPIERLPEWSSSWTPSELSFTFLGTNSATHHHQDRASEEGSSRTPALCRRRSQEMASSVSDTSPEEDVALCLMLLSKDSWTKPIQKEPEREPEEEDEEDEAEEEEIEKPRYRCGTCKKGFRSYQALGGHRASHKKIKIQLPVEDGVHHHHQEEEEADQSRVADTNGTGNHKRTFECPYCSKKFNSGQALGGHKKIHPSNNTHAALSTSSNAASSSARIGSNKSIDLNQPPPMDDDEATGHFTQLSAVSDAAMHHPVRFPNPCFF